MNDSVLKRYNIDLSELRERLAHTQDRLAQAQLDQATRVTL